ncbi:MAG: squalene/phytoene synthase family protein [Myxococcota bacterium]
MDRLGTIPAALSRLTQRSSSNFKFAFLFLGPAQREGLKAVYEFCRVVDDIVDEREPGEAGVQRARRELAEWSREIGRIYGDPYRQDDPPHTELGKELARTHAIFDYPRHGFDEIIAGVAMDLERSTYDDMDGLRLYCYRVASCVGFLCIAIFGDSSEPANRYAEHLGLALQYTNILRDVAEDAARQRVYLPGELLSRHGLSRVDILEQRYDERFVAMASDFADQAEREYRQAWAALSDTDLRRLLPAEVMGRTYHRILREIRERNYDVFTRRATLRRRDKLKAAAVALARTSLGQR